MAAKKIITVIGATGAQGGGVARAILADTSGEFSVRAVTRKPHSEKALALKEAGAEVVNADLEDVDGLRHAFEGAHGAYCVTNYWEHFAGDKEMAHAHNMAKAAKQAGVKHAIWSTLEDVRKWYPLSDNRMPTIAILGTFAATPTTASPPPISISKSRRNSPVILPASNWLPKLVWALKFWRRFHFSTYSPFTDANNSPRCVAAYFSSRNSVSHWPCAFFNSGPIVSCAAFAIRYSGKSKTCGGCCARS